MANFRPLKNYLLYLIDQLVEKHGLRGPFLDIGCGRGDISLHFARKGWAGKAIDPSGEAVAAAKKTLAPHENKVVVEQGDIFQVEGQYRTLILCDVLEHVANDEELLHTIRRNTFRDPAGSHLIFSAPIFLKEWRWDDRFYGHVRRYEIEELLALLRKENFDVLDIWDFTFPLFWLLRRIYTRALPEKKVLGTTSERLSRESSLQSSWDMGALSAVFENGIWWKPVFHLQSRFKKCLKGCECVLAAKFVG